MPRYIFDSVSLGSRDFVKQWRKNEALLFEQDRQAKEAGQLVGRFVQEPIADGYAIYVIMKENKKTIRIQAVRGMGDDYRVPYWGEGTSVNKAYAVKSICRRDALNGIFAKNKDKRVDYTAYSNVKKGCQNESS